MEIKKMLNVIWPFYPSPILMSVKWDWNSIGLSHCVSNAIYLKSVPGKLKPFSVNSVPTDGVGVTYFSWNIPFKLDPTYKNRTCRVYLMTQLFFRKYLRSVHTICIKCLALRTFVAFKTFTRIISNFYSCCSHLEHRASAKRFVSLQFLNFRLSVGLLGRGISQLQGLYIHTEQQKDGISANNIDIHALSGIRIHDSNTRCQAIGINY
jgi:hypothetical protein